MSIKNLRRLMITFILALALVFTGLVLPGSVYTAEAESSTVHYLAVASDRHDTPSAIPLAMNGMPDSVEYVCLDGDMTDRSGGSPGGAPPDMRIAASGQKAYDTSTLVEEVQSVFPGLTTDKISVVYGSHDANATDDAGIMKCADTDMLPNGDDSAEISAGFSGLIYTGPDGDDEDELPDYYVYGVSYYDLVGTETVSETDEEGNETTTYKKASQYAETSSEAFRTWVKTINESDPDVPIIVIGHVPLHYKRNDNYGATYWSAALNYAATGSDTVDEDAAVNREVVYLHGHNHTVETTEYFYEPGDSIDLQAASDKDENPVSSVIQYTYITAGYLRDNHTATLITVDGTDLSFTKYKGCVVTFDSQGGSDVDSQNVTKDAYASEPDDPTRDGYTFTGWYAEAACENAWDFSSDAITDDVTLYAGWVKGSKPGKVKISTAVTASEGKTKLSWSSVGADDYRVSYRKAGSSRWKRLWSNGRTSVTVKGLSKKGLYEFKVNAANESGDRYIYGSDSKIVRRYIARVSNVKAKGKKKAVKLSWKKLKGVSGYRIQYSANKSMKNAVTVNVSSKKSSYTIKKLAKNKKYYVRVRAIRKNGDTAYIGQWSVRKAVKTK